MGNCRSDLHTIKQTSANYNTMACVCMDAIACMCMQRSPLLYCILCAVVMSMLTRCVIAADFQCHTLASIN